MGIRVRVILLSSIAGRDVDALMGHVDAKSLYGSDSGLSSPGSKRARSRMRCIRVCGMMKLVAGIGKEVRRLVTKGMGRCICGAHQTALAADVLSSTFEDP